MVNPCDAIAQAVLDVFKALPENRKPAVRTNGIREWVPLSGIVAEFQDGEYVCVSLATGMKCLPASKLPLSNGVGLHDWHAEVLALRCFNRFVLQECYDLLLTGDSSSFLQFAVNDWQADTEDGTSSARQPNSTKCAQPFEWRPGVSLHMYCSTAPCGDASMELTMAAQDDDSPWEAPSTNGNDDSVSTTLLSGRGYFSRLGTVRRKPGRGDAPSTLSKSCSDKIALRQCTSLLNGISSLFVNPGHCYLRSVVLPESQYSATGCRRCFSADMDSETGKQVGRMAPVVDASKSWQSGYKFSTLDVQTTTLEFEYARSIADEGGKKLASSNLSVAWTLNGVNECLVNGVLRGRKAFNPTGASATSRRQLWTFARELATKIEDSDAMKGLKQLFIEGESYADIKNSTLQRPRAQVKEDVKRLALQGWVSNKGDEDWRHDMI